MNKFLISLAVLIVCLTNAVTSGPFSFLFEEIIKRFNESESVSSSWDLFKRRNNRFYVSKEEPIRRSRFQDFLTRVNDHNSLFRRGEISYFSAVNDFADMTDDERNSFLGLSYDSSKMSLKRVMSRNNRPEFFSYNPGKKIPASVDYRTSGWTEPVRNQKNCGSCWSFSATSVFSYYTFRTTKKNLIFSPQNLVDCSGSFGNDGCNGGWPAYAFQYIIQKKITLESSYPYRGSNRRCNVPRNANLYTAKSYVAVKNDENSLKQAVADIGPVVVALDADYLFYYGGGIWDGTFRKNKCNPSRLNHAVTVIGYGSVDTQNYWIIKNSWGTSWGENGIFRMKMDGSNLCGILSAAYTLN